MKAVVAETKGKIVVKDIPKPTLAPHEALVKVRAVTLNPTDWKHAHYLAEDGAIIGCDLAGEVVEVGSDVKRLQVGDRVASLVHGGRKMDDKWEEGAFAEYAKVNSEVAWKLPDSFTDWEAAACLAGVSPHTTFQHLTLRHGLPWPGEGSTNGEPFLIWSASTSVGMTAIQYAKLIGCTVIGTASEKNWDLLRSFGADDLYDYKDPEAPAKISAKYPNLRHALDCISEGDSTQLTAKSLGKDGGYITRLLAANKDDNAGRGNVKVEAALGYTLMGRAFSVMGRQIPAIPSDYEGAKKWANIIPGLVAEGKIRSNPLLRQKGGLDKVPEGLQMLKDGKVSAQKISYAL